MEKNSRTEMLPGKQDLYRCCKARRSASHVNIILTIVFPGSRTVEYQPIFHGVT